MKIIWSPKAIQRLEEIFDYISLESPANAHKFTDEIFNKIEILIDFPNAGRIVPELNNEKYRELIHGNYRIIYSILKNQIHILAIRHSKRLFDENEIN